MTMCNLIYYLYFLENVIKKVAPHHLLMVPSSICLIKGCGPAPFSRKINRRLRGVPIFPLEFVAGAAERHRERRRAET